MMYDATKEEQKRFRKFTKEFRKFTKELSELCKKHGVVVSVCGGVDIVSPNDKALENLHYTDDATSGDLYPCNFFDN